MINHFDNSDKIKVLHVINSFEVGGAEILLKNVILNFNDKNFDLVVAYLRGGGYLLKDIDSSYPIYDLSINNKFSIRCLFSLIKIIVRHKIRILHTHDPQGGIIARIAAIFCGIKIIATTRHNPDLIGNHSIVYKIENYLLRKNTVIIAISRSVKNRLIEKYKIEENRIKIIYNSIDLSLYQLEPRKIADANEPYIIGTVARLTHQKGIDILIRAFKLFSKNIPNSLLYIVGGGPKKKDLETLASSLDLKQKIIFFGTLAEKEVKSTLLNFDVFVLASRWEGFGISLIEAMSLGKPVIGSDVDGISEIIDHGINGMLFKKENEQHLAEMIYKVSQDTSLQKIISDNAMQTVKDKYDIKQYCKLIGDQYSELLNNHGT